MQQIQDLYWEDHAVTHLAESDITPEDVEEIIFGSDDEEPKTLIKRHGDNYEIYGQTGNGSLILIVGEFMGEGSFRPFGGRQMNENEKKAFRNRGDDGCKDSK